MPAENPSGPETTIRLGNISASVFLNQAESGREFRNVVLQRSYKDTEGNRQFANSFNVADLPVVQRVTQLAQEYIERLEVLLNQEATS